MTKETIPFSWWSKNHNSKCITVYDNDIARATSIQEAVFIRRFIFLWEKWKSNDGIFIVPKTFCSKVGMSTYAFRKIVNAWEDCNIIKTKSKGLPLKKWYKLDEKKLAEYLTNLKEKGSITYVIENDKIGYRKRQDKVIENDKIYSSNSKSNNSQRSAGESNCFDQFKEKNTKPKGYELACKLYKALKKKRKIFASPNIKKWCAEFSKLEQHVPKSQIKQVISWYGKNIGEEYINEAYCAQSFCLKFPSIVNKMEKDTNIVLGEDPRKIKEGDEVSDEMLDQIMGDGAAEERRKQRKTTKKRQKRKKAV